MRTDLNRAGGGPGDGDQALAPLGGHRLVAANRFPSRRRGQGSANADRVSDARRGALEAAAGGNRIRPARRG